MGVECPELFFSINSSKLLTRISIKLFYRGFTGDLDCRLYVSEYNWYIIKCNNQFLFLKFLQYLGNTEYNNIFYRNISDACYIRICKIKTTAIFIICNYYTLTHISALVISVDYCNQIFQTNINYLYLCRTQVTFCSG